MPQSLRLLLVDDSDVIRGMLRYVFVKLGHSVVAEAGTGGAALAAFKEHKPDLVLLDISLPDMNGVDVLKALRALDPAAKVVIVTGNNSSVLRQEVLDAGALAVVLKPFDIAAFTKVFDRLGGPP